ncbi:hypothetical protein HB816_15985 [Listeria booriae]|uniref:hypothetical protein n=1 Tax=Listeria booriae TaxID=1552123 RepID=UPI00162AF37C|nr:hypothetical protein [Listeria booriae]MBC1231952.1 hypothetical protein [Listeria booriae]
MNIILDFGINFVAFFIFVLAPFLIKLKSERMTTIFQGISMFTGIFVVGSLLFLT